MCTCLHDLTGVKNRTAKGLTFRKVVMCLGAGDQRVLRIRTTPARWSPVHGGSGASLKGFQVAGGGSMVICFLVSNSKHCYYQ